MSSHAHSPVTWADFLRLPERPDTGQRYELHDGEVVLVPPARPLHIKLQKRIEHLLESLAGERGVVTIEFPTARLPISSTRSRMLPIFRVPIGTRCRPMNIRFTRLR